MIREKDRNSLDRSNDSIDSTLLARSLANMKSPNIGIIKSHLIPRLIRRAVSTRS